MVTVSLQPRFVSALLPALLGTASLLAQSYTASIRGLVTDQTQSAVPNASITAVDARRNIRQTTTSDDAGRYVLTNLPPGVYSLAVEATGFKKYTRESFDLQISQDATINVVLQVGEITESVSVTAEAPLLESSTSSIGKVVDNQKITNLPLNARNVYQLIYLTPGFVGAVGFNYGDMRFSVNGGRQRMLETLADGVPSSHPTVNGTGGVAVFPSVDAIEEFKVVGANPSAEYGRSQGSVVNVVFKSGTNQWHGSAYEFLRNSVLDANSWSANRNRQPLTSFKRNQFGGTFSGPVMRDKTFFLASYEGLRERSAAGTTTSVPTDPERTGDFSQTLAGANRPVIVYNPFSLSGGLRAPFAENRIPASLLDPVALNVIKYYPRSTSAGDPFTQKNNFFRTGSAAPQLDQWDVRLDHNLSSSQRIYGRYSHRLQKDVPAQFFPNDLTVAEGRIVQANDGHAAVVDYSNSLTPTAILDARIGFARTLFTYDNQSLGFVPSSLGLPASIDLAADRLMFPALSVGGYRSLGGGDHRNNAFNTLTGIASLSRVQGAHSWKTGFEVRVIRVNVWEARDAAAFNFTATMTQGPNPNTASSTAGNGLASLLLGAGSSGNLYQNWKNVAAQSFYYAGYIQDDWRVTTKLTLNLGLRWDYDQPRTERFDRFNYLDLSPPSPVAAQVKALPAASNCPACADLRGGLVFVNVGGTPRHQYTADRNNFAPRLGLAYQALPKTVIRMGYGHMFGISAQQALGTVGADGFRVNNTWVTSLDGVTPLNLLRHPYPSGFAPPPRAAAGLMTGAGGNIEAPLQDTPTPWTMQWNFTLQQELPWHMMLETAYVGTRGLQLSRGGEGGLRLNQLNPTYMALGTQLQQLVDNPFFGVVNSGILASRQVSRAQLLRPLPQFGDVVPLFSSGSSSTYHSLQVTYKKRTTHGVTFEGNYTWSKNLDNGESHQDAYNIRASRALTDIHIAHRFVMSFIYELPFGRGRRFGGGISPLANTLLGGWQINGYTTYHTGNPLSISASNRANIFSQTIRASNNGTSARLEGDRHDRLERWFNTSVFSQPAAFTFGNVGTRLPDVSNDGGRNWDLSIFKEFYPIERMRVQFRAEAFNAFNTVRFGGPNTDVNAGASFGRVTSQSNSPRQVQFGLKLLW